MSKKFKVALVAITEEYGQWPVGTYTAALSHHKDADGNDRTTTAGNSIIKVVTDQPVPHTSYTDTGKQSVAALVKDSELPESIGVTNTGRKITFKAIA
jgi:hypothetical protein